MNRRPTRNNNPANNKPFVSGGVMTNFTASAPTVQQPAQVSVPAPTPVSTSSIL